jgi:hypothetical protein
MYGCAKYTDSQLPPGLQPCSEDSSQAQVGLAAIYFLVYIVVGTFVMLNLFIGVIIIAMEATMSKIAQENSIQRRARALAKAEGITSAEMQQFKEMFEMLDSDGSGDLDLEEVQIAVKLSGERYDTPT